MPTYDVKCTSCNLEDEVWRKPSEPNPPCTLCGGVVDTQLLTATPVNFKGGGWTNGDFGTTGKMNRNGSLSKTERSLREEVNAEDGIYSDKVV